MPLSEHEQRILDEIERRLSEEDPKFARSASAATPRGVAIRRVKRASGGFFLGLAILVSGLVVGLDDGNLIVVFGLAGFAVMLTSIIVIFRASRDIGPPATGHRSSWVERMEERWKKRFEDGQNRS
ncbi:MAG TPA: DUF3040 domain-containing protein [Actinomycetota bacterium]